MKILYMSLFFVFTSLAAQYASVKVLVFYLQYINLQIHSSSYEECLYAGKRPRCLFIVHMIF